MKHIQKLAVISFISTISFGVIGCAGMSEQGQNTAIGAGAGALGGAVLTGGSPVGTVGGAAVGGIIGHVVSKPNRKH